MPRRAFTLIETIVVIVLLGVLAGLTAPRLFRDEARRADIAVESVAGVLGVIAQRESLGTVRMALTYDASKRLMRLERLALPTDNDGRLVGLSRRESGEWKADPLAPGVPLGSVRIESVRVDGETLDDDQWRIEFVPGEPRPLVEFELEATIDGRPRTWRVELLPYAAEAEISNTTSGRSRTDDALRSTDLDRMGLSEVAW